MSFSTFRARIRQALDSEITKASNLYSAEMRRSVTTPLPLAKSSTTSESSSATAPISPAGPSAPLASSSKNVSSTTPLPTASTTIAVATSFIEPKLENTMNFAAILAAIQMLASLLPSIESLVNQAETIIGAGNGSSKLAYVETSVNAFLEKAVSDVAVLSSLKTLLAPTISAIVTAANLKGLFTKAAAPVAVGAAVVAPAAAA